MSDDELEELVGEYDRGPDDYLDGVSDEELAAAIALSEAPGHESGGGEGRTGLVAAPQVRHELARDDLQS